MLRRGDLCSLSYPHSPAASEYSGTWGSILEITDRLLTRLLEQGNVTARLLIEY